MSDCGYGGTGRRAGLKIRWAIRPCRFDSGYPHHFAHFATLAPLALTQQSGFKLTIKIKKRGFCFFLTFLPARFARDLVRPLCRRCVILLLNKIHNLFVFKIKTHLPISFAWLFL